MHKTKSFNLQWHILHTRKEVGVVGSDQRAVLAINSKDDIFNRANCILYLSSKFICNALYTQYTVTITKHRHQKILAMIISH